MIITQYFNIAESAFYFVEFIFGVSYSLDKYMARYFPSEYEATG
jgi:hypothetical protein